MDMSLFTRWAAVVLMFTAVVTGPASARAYLIKSYAVLGQRGRVVYVDVGLESGVVPGRRMRFADARRRLIVGEVQFVDATGRATVKIGKHEVVDARVRAMPTHEPQTATWILPPHRSHGGALRWDAGIGLDNRSAQGSAAVQWRLANGGILLAQIGEFDRHTFGDGTLATVDIGTARAGVGWQWRDVSVCVGFVLAGVRSTVSGGTNGDWRSATGLFAFPYYRIQLGPEDGLNAEAEIGAAAPDLGTFLLRAAVPVRDGTILNLGLHLLDARVDSDASGDNADDRIWRYAGTLSVRHRLFGDEGPGTRYLRIGARAGVAHFSGGAEPTLPAESPPVANPLFLSEKRFEASLEFGMEWRF